MYKCGPRPARRIKPSNVSHPLSRMLVRWSHCYDIELLGVGNSIKLIVPLYCLRPTDNLLVQSVIYKSNELHIAADILRNPFLSPYISPARIEPPESEPQLR